MDSSDLIILVLVEDDIFAYCLLFGSASFSHEDPDVHAISQYRSPSHSDTSPI